jgi:hypothetical protein
MKFQHHTSSAPPNFPRLFAFSKMSSEQQENFIQRRFESIDPSELLNIVRAIYGHPHDKGRPRCSRDPSPSTQSSSLRFASGNALGPAKTKKLGISVPEQRNVQI